MRLAIDTYAYRVWSDGSAVITAEIQKAPSVAFCAMVLGELRAGFANRTRHAENEAILVQVLSRNRVGVLNVTESTSAIYASVWAGLRSKGRQIPTNDIWIAALCLEHDFTLLTLDGHFKEVTGLKALP